MPIAGDLSDLAGKVVLVVEDDYFLASEMAEAVRHAGATPLGPVPDVANAMAAIGDSKIDAAILDVHLGDEFSFPIATALRANGVRVVFVTGYDNWFLPNDLDDIPVYRKPADPDNVVRMLLNPETNPQS